MVSFKGTSRIHQRNEHVRNLYLYIVFSGKMNPMKIHFHDVGN